MIHPKGNKITIRPDKPEEVTQGGLHLTKPKTPDTGTVVEISPDIPQDELLLKENGYLKAGDRVRYLPNHRLEEGEVILVDLANILFVFNN